MRILAISLSGDFRKPLKHKVLTREEKKDRALLQQGFAAADQSLGELTRITGGRVYFPKNQKDFDRAHGEISQLIRPEYNHAFTPPVHDRQIHAMH